MYAVGTNGFTWNLENRKVFRDQMAIVVDTLRPTGIIVYGPAYDYVFQYAMDARIPIYQYDSHTMKRNAERQAEAKKRSKMAKSNKELEGDLYER